MPLTSEIDLATSFILEDAWNLKVQFFCEMEFHIDKVNTFRIPQTF